MLSPDQIAREALDQWSFVAAAYVVGLGAVVALIGWSLFAMLRAESRRDRSREP